MDLPGSGALSSALLASALDSAGVAVVVTDLALDPPGPLIRYVNVTFEEMTGYEASEVLGKSPRLLQGPRTDRAVLLRLKRSLIEDRRFHGQAINYRKDGSTYTVEWIITPVRDVHGKPTHWIAFQRDVDRDRPPHRAFDAELQHRTGNLLGTVRAIAARTLSDKADAAAFGLRLAALGRAQRMLGPDSHGTIELGALLRNELAAHGVVDGGATLRGAPVAVPVAMVEMLTLALHELIDNAQAHGALRVPQAAVTIEWRVAGVGHRRSLSLDWIETGTAPLPAGRRRRGYGLELLQRALPFSLKAKTALTFQADGMRCKIDLPLAAAPEGPERKPAS